MAQPGLDDAAVDLLIATVCASIGLQIHVRTLIEVGWRVVVIAGVAWTTIALLSVVLLLTSIGAGLVVGVVAKLLQLILKISMVVILELGHTEMDLLVCPIYFSLKVNLDMKINFFIILVE